MLAYLAALLTFLSVVGGWRAFSGWTSGDEAEHLHGWQRYFKFNSDHKVVGVQYTVISLVIFIVSGLMALMMRWELSRPGLQLLDHDQYNTIMGIHGIGMVVVALIAIVGGLGNFAVPLQLGARDMAFPRLNALSFWMVPPAVVLLLTCPLVGGFDFGWTAYPPLSTKGPYLGKLFFVLAFVTVGFSSIFGGVNFMTTIFRLRAKGMSWMRMPIFVWSVLSASIIMLMGTSVVAASLIMIMFDRVLGTVFFNPAQGGNVLLYQHLFWYYSHPAVYIMILPAFGVILEILPVFSRKPLFAYPIAAFSFVAIVVLSFIVWAHHMFTSGMWSVLKIPFMVTTELISIPTGAVFMSALGTIWAGRIRMRMPMLFAFGFIFNFLIGGLTGIFHADVPTDLHIHDTWLRAFPFHYRWRSGVRVLCRIHYWFPDRTHDERNTAFHFVFFRDSMPHSSRCSGRDTGMRRRVADFPPHLTNRRWISCAATIIAAGVASVQRCALR